MNSLSVKLFYPELKHINCNKELMQKLFHDKKDYQKNILPFIKHLIEYQYADDNGQKKHLENSTIISHLVCLSDLDSTDKKQNYISFIKENNLEHTKFSTQIIKDENFYELYYHLKDVILNDNIQEIIKSGNSHELLQFIQKNKYKSINYTHINDKILEFLKNEPFLGDIKVIDLFWTNLDLLGKILKEDVWDGLQYTYNNIETGKDFILHSLLRKARNNILILKLFSNDFIENMGDSYLTLLYKRISVLEEKEIDTILQIYYAGNIELIHDIINFKPENFHFHIKTEDLNKNLLFIESDYPKWQIFLKKYLGINLVDIPYIKTFLHTINRVREKLSPEFITNYKPLLDLLTQVIESSDEHILKISNSLNPSLVEEYKKLMVNCEAEGNIALKKYFVNDLYNRNQKMIEPLLERTISTTDNQEIKVHVFSGQPFTMLVHQVADNSSSYHNNIAHQILKDPSCWYQSNAANQHISTSLIDDSYMITYGGTPNNNNTLMLGFFNIPWENVKMVFSRDAAIDRNANTDINYNMRVRGEDKLNTIATIKDVMEQTHLRHAYRETHNQAFEWNEIVLKRENSQTGQPLKPDYIVCMDKISDTSKKAALYFQIPIYLIERKYYLGNDFHRPAVMPKEEFKQLEEERKMKK